ncbi:MAG TPA: response regulator [Candidatus Omnitrophota bacterium]|nr:response regulator [Candidatus Omnitrophota bacterium]
MDVKKKILIVDDEVGIVDEIRDFLTEEGYEVKTADTVKAGISLVTEFKPDVLIVDMKLPDASGIDVLRVCRNELPNTKTLVVTGYVDQKVMDEAENMGRDMFLQKPFDLVTLIEEIQKFLN